MRLGITVSRKVGGAVIRNRVKRRIREWFRSWKVDLDQSFDLVIIAKPGAAALKSPEFQQELSELMNVREHRGLRGSGS